MKAVTLAQSHTAMAILAQNVDWHAIDADQIQNGIIRDPTGAGRQFTVFLQNGGRVIVGEPKILRIDRSEPFNPAEFLGEGWTISEEDERSLALTEVDLTKIRFETMLRKGESYVNGEEKLRRLKEAGHIRLDTAVFLKLWQNPHLIPESWKDGKLRYFDGTVLRGPGGDRYVLFLYWDEGPWHWNYRWLGIDCYACSPSAVLAS